MRTQHIHQQLQSFGFVKCTNPAHNSRGYNLKHQKAIAQIDIFFNSFELLDEATQILKAQGVKVKQCWRDIADGCWLSIEQNQGN